MACHCTSIIVVVGILILLQCTLLVVTASVTPSSKFLKRVATNNPLNPYDTVNHKDKKKIKSTYGKGNVLVLNSSTCRDISYQLALQWSSDMPAPDVSITQSLSRISSYCPSLPPRKTRSDIIDLVCHIRVGIKPKITMVSLPRCLATAWLTLAALRLPLPGGVGDIVETGTWRGGMSILSLMLMKKYGHCGGASGGGGGAGGSRKFWAFDSFQGLPAPITIDRYKGKQGQWSTTRDDFISNLKSFDVYHSGNVIVTQGYFNDTLPHSEVKEIAFLRLDGDLYESTRDALRYLYDKVIVGGFIYVDDYNSFVGCKLAVDEFLRDRGLAPVLSSIKELNYEARAGFKLKKGEAVWWQKSEQ